MEKIDAGNKQGYCRYAGICARQIGCSAGTIAVPAALLMCWPARRAASIGGS
jgi:hypothetical protein